MTSIRKVLPRTGLARRAGGAVACQGTAAAGNLVLQVVAARALGAAGFGTFSIVIAVLVLSAALVGGWVGDTRTVLDRSEPAIRGALSAFQVGFTLVAGVATFAGAWISGITGLSGALLFGLLSALWVLEDAARRLLMTRLEFWGVVINDLIYLGAAVAGLVAFRALTGAFSIDVFLAAMVIGAAASVVAARFQMPSEEFALGQPTMSGIRSVASFGSGRSAQAGLRPFATLALRAFVQASASAAALGRLEAARLAIAPMLLIINGAGSYLLPVYTRRLIEDSERPVAVGRLTAILVATTACYGVVLTVFADRLIPLLTGRSLTVDRWAVAGWSLFAAAFAAGIPAGNALLARRRSWRVFRVRAADSSIGLVVAIALVAAGRVAGAPYGLALGAAIGAVLLWAQASRDAVATCAERAA